MDIRSLLEVSVGQISKKKYQKKAPNVYKVTYNRGTESVCGVKRFCDLIKYILNNLFIMASKTG